MNNNKRCGLGRAVLCFYGVISKKGVWNITKVFDEVIEEIYG